MWIRTIPQFVDNWLGWGGALRSPAYVHKYDAISAWHKYDTTSCPPTTQVNFLFNIIMLTRNFNSIIHNEKGESSFLWNHNSRYLKSYFIFVLNKFPPSFYSKICLNNNFLLPIKYNFFFKPRLYPVFGDSIKTFIPIFLINVDMDIFLQILFIYLNCLGFSLGNCLAVQP